VLLPQTTSEKFRDTCRDEIKTFHVSQISFCLWLVLASPLTTGACSKQRCPSNFEIRMFVCGLFAGSHPQHKEKAAHTNRHEQTFANPFFLSCNVNSHF